MVDSQCVYKGFEDTQLRSVVFDPNTWGCVHEEIVMGVGIWIFSLFVPPYGGTFFFKTFVICLHLDTLWKLI